VPGTTAVLNAANEVAVAAFLDGQIRFDQIHAVNLETLARFVPAAPVSLQDLLAIDQEARSQAISLVRLFQAASGARYDGA
jgi:1-deoxy-D-xylulose-5-phosphate reductoisomerase